MTTRTEACCTGKHDVCSGSVFNNGWKDCACLCHVTVAVVNFSLPGENPHALIAMQGLFQQPVPLHA